MSKRSTKQVARTAKQRLEIRPDSRLAARIAKLAKDSDISVNQLVCGVLRWALDNAHPGEPVDLHSGPIETRNEPGVVWFGKDGYDDEGNERGQGDLVFALDFSGRHAVRDASEFYGLREG